MKGMLVAVVGVATLIVVGCVTSPTSPGTVRPDAAPTASPSPYPTPYVAPKVPETSFPPCVPGPTPSPGIDAGSVQVGPSPWDEFVTSDQWIGPKPGSGLSLYQVFAGVTGDEAKPPGVPAVWVNVITFSSDRCSTNGTTIGDFLDATAGGRLTITSVAVPLVSLQSAKGTRLSFDLVTHRFAAAHAQPSR